MLFVCSFVASMQTKISVLFARPKIKVDAHFNVNSAVVMGLTVRDMSKTIKDLEENNLYDSHGDPTCR